MAGQRGQGLCWLGNEKSGPGNNIPAESDVLPDPAGPGNWKKAKPGIQSVPVSDLNQAERGWVMFEHLAVPHNAPNSSWTVPLCTINMSFPLGPFYSFFVVGNQTEKFIVA